MKDFLLNLLLIFIGVSSGAVVAAGLYAFLIVIGTVTRLVSKIEGAKDIRIFEDIIVLGASFGNILYVFHIRVPLNIIGLILFGGFSGVFVGCLSSAIAETVETIPVFNKRIKLKIGLPYIMLSMALGKSLASFYQIYINWSPK